MNKLLCVIAVLGLSACGATGAQFAGFKEPDAGQSRLYVYRPWASFGGGVYYQVQVENEVIGRLRNGGYIEKQLKPGTYRLWGETEIERDTNITLNADSIQCVRSKIRLGVLVGRPVFETVSLEQCNKEIVETKASE